MEAQTRIVRIYNEIGGYDVCEIEANGTRVLRVLDSSHNRSELVGNGNNGYAMQYSYACGYRD